MFRYLQNRLQRLRSQLIATFLVGFLGIGLAIGLPVLLLIRQQATSHAQLLLDQGTVASRAFLQGEQADLQNLALLTSQRPTLQRLLAEQNVDALNEYLNTLRTSVDLDLILICSGGREIASLPASPVGAEMCQQDPGFGYTVLSSDDLLYLYAAADVESEEAAPHTVIIGKHASLILSDLQEETGLLYVLLWQDQAIHSGESPFAITPAMAAGLRQNATESTIRSLTRQSFEMDGHRYLLSSMVIDPSLGLSLISALNVDDQIAVQQRLSNSFLFALLLIILLASGFGIWLSQRISRPMARLADAAAAFRQGNLDTPISVPSPVWEIDQLSNTLEDGRVALQHSLQQLQAEKAWMEHLLNSIVEGMVTLNPHNRITFVSAGISKITGLEPGQLLDQNIDDIFLPVEGDVHFSNQLPEMGQQRRVQVRLPDGGERLLSISKSKLVPPEASGSNLALVIRDVSNEEYIHRLLGDFMANITHEFRTPLAALEASTELLLDNLHSLSPAEIEELLVSLNLGIINLQTLIDNLIEAASIEAGRFRVFVQKVPFDQILREAVGVVQPLAEKYSLSIMPQRVDENIVVMADQRRTVQVLVNLLSNAIKHAPENSPIQIRHTLLADQLRVEVMDEGRGIPAGQRGNLFRRFAHLDTNNERARQGAGLGLSVVKEIVEAQQGEVGVTERPQGGASFWFSLRLANGREEE